MAKTCLLYGFISALAQALMTLGLFFTGMHSDPSKLAAAGWISSILGLVIGITCILLCVRSVRAQTPADKPFGYGAALGAGSLQGLFSSILTAAFTYVYCAFVNPNYCQVLLDGVVDKLQSKGVSGDQLDKMEGFYRHIYTPGVLGIFGVVFGFIFAFILALIIAAFCRRKAPAAPPLV
ncbi:MAG TPA: DUF4199 domain-containing protein [Opitutaceae bacterium]|jgi:hypothetical protein